MARRRKVVNFCLPNGLTRYSALSSTASTGRTGVGRCHEPCDEPGRVGCRSERMVGLTGRLGEQGEQGFRAWSRRPDTTPSCTSKTTASAGEVKASRHADRSLAGTRTQERSHRTELLSSISTGDVNNCAPSSLALEVSIYQPSSGRPGERNRMLLSLRRDRRFIECCNAIH